MEFDDIAKVIAFIALILGLGVSIGIAIDKSNIKEAYCTKYTHTIQEYKACKSSNLVEFINKEGGK